jgi:hypothetical protein
MQSGDREADAGQGRRRAPSPFRDGIGPGRPRSGFPCGAAGASGISMSSAPLWRRGISGVSLRTESVAFANGRAPTAGSPEALLAQGNGTRGALHMPAGARGLVRQLAVGDWDRVELPMLPAR